MLETASLVLDRLREHVRLADVLDIVVIAVLIYIAQGWFRQRASRSVAIAIVMLVLLYMVAHVLDMYLTILLFKAGFVAVLLALIIVFQEDLRRGFERMASWSIFDTQAEALSHRQTIDTLVESMLTMAQHHIGTLVVIKGREDLNRHVRGGVEVDGRMSLPLLYSIFHPETPGHDGALMVDGDIIEKIGVHLPLSKNLPTVGHGGTRHAAALGLAERSDALVIAVSEERGTVSIAHGGQLKVLDPPTELQGRLEEYYRSLGTSPGNQDGWRSWLYRDLAIKTSSLLLAVLLWLLFASNFENVQRILVASVQYRNLPEEWTIDDPKPTTARVTLSGSERLFDLLDPDSLIITVDLASVREGTHDVLLTEGSVNSPAGLSVVNIDPQIVPLEAFRTIRVDLPVEAHLQHSVPDDLKLERVIVQPAEIPVRMRRSLRDSIRVIRTDPIDLREVKTDTSRVISLVIPDHVQLADEAKPAVQVTLDVEPAESTEPPTPTAVPSQ